MILAASSSFMSSRMKISICFAQSGIAAVGREALDGRGVAARERQVVQAVLGEQRGVREPRPAPVRIAQEFLVDEFEHRGAPSAGSGFSA